MRHHLAVVNSSHLIALPARKTENRSVRPPFPDLRCGEHAIMMCTLHDAQLPSLIFAQPIEAASFLLDCPRCNPRSTPPRMRIKPLSYFKKTGSNSKPRLPLSKTAIAAGRQIQKHRFAILIVGVILFVFFVLKAGSASSTNLRGGLIGFNGSPYICSHQLLNAPPLSSSASHSKSTEGPPDGSLAAMRSFWSAGVKCFDIDIVTLKDGSLLASHPSRLAKVTNGAKAEEHTLSSLRKAGADPTAYPLLGEVLAQYARLVRGHPNFYYQPARNQLQGPLLNLDLKGPALTEGHLMQIVDQLYSLKIQENVAFCVAALLQGEIDPGIDVLKVLANSGNSRLRPVRMGLVLRDRVPEDVDVDRIQRIVQEYSSSIKLLVPSFKFKEDWFREIHQRVGLPATAWTIDTWEQLEYARQMGVPAVVANRPMDFAAPSTS